MLDFDNRINLIVAGKRPLKSFQINNFRTEKNRILGQLGLLALIAQDLHSEIIQSELEKTRSDLEADTFQFVVVGEFSRGKSTVINALLGDRILPSSVEPTTTVLTKITGGSSLSFTVSYRDGRLKETISDERFKALVAPPEPPQHHKEHRLLYDERQSELRSIAMVEITHPSSICSEGVEIIDTPGTNDLDPLREQITYDYLPRADAILFVLTARGAVTQSEFDFLENRVLATDTARIFFLLNYADTLSPADLATVRDRGLRDLAKLVPNPRIYAVSAKKALLSRSSGTASTSDSNPDGGFGDLEVALASFLESDRASAKLSRPRSRGVRFCDELLGGPLVMARSTIGLEIPELRKRIEDLSPKMQLLQERSSKTIATLKLRLDNRRNALIIRMRDGLYKLADVALHAVDTYDGPIRPEELGRHIEARVAPVQSQFQSAFRMEVSEAFSSEIRKVESELSESQLDLHRLFDPEASANTSRFELDDSKSSGGGWALLHIGGAGIGLLLLPFFAPLALIAGWFGGAFAAGQIEQATRSKRLGQVRNAVDERYRGTISESVNQFEELWQDAVRATVSDLALDFKRRCDQARNALETALIGLTDANQVASQLRIDMDSLETRILAIRQALLQEVQQ